jgi:signal transduction histidine kinase/ActR/RegA family two-component response regulator
MRQRRLRGATLAKSGARPHPVRRKDTVREGALACQMPQTNAEFSILLESPKREEIFKTQSLNGCTESEQLLLTARQAQMEADAANCAKDEFIAMIAHELRTPLTAMLGWIKLLRGGKLGADNAAKGLEVLERNIRIQARLIEDLLDVSRIIAGKMSLEKTDIELSAIVKGVVESVRQEAKARRLSLRLHAGGELYVSGDPQRLGQVVANLLSNSLKFTPPGGRIEISLKKCGQESVLSLSDTGIGIAPEVLPTLFRRFHQADSSITRQYSGLGLGLSIVRYIVERHGGRVEAHSQGLNRGAVFIVRLPLLPLPPPVRPKRPEPGKMHNHFLAGLRAVLAEDDPDARELLAVTLESYGAMVRQTASAGGVIQALDEAPADLLLADICLPDQNGYDLIKKVRARATEAGGNIPAVAVTAFSKAGNQEKALAAGFQAYLPKPVEPEKLAEVIEKLLGRRASRPILPPDKTAQEFRPARDGLIVVRG